MNKALVTAALVSLAAACGGDQPEEMNHDHMGHEHNNATTATVDTYADGLMKMGDNGNFHVMLMSANPGPPDVGENTWTLRIMDMDDNPVDGAKVTVTPFMPAHGHGTTPADYSATFTENGTYTVGPFDLFMPGVWETTVKVEGDAEDMVKFSFELEG